MTEAEYEALKPGDKIYHINFPATHIDGVSWWEETVDVVNNNGLVLHGYEEGHSKELVLIWYYCTKRDALNVYIERGESLIPIITRNVEAAKKELELEEQND